MFTLDYFKAYAHLPLRTRIWHGALFAVFFLILSAGSYFLRVSGEDQSPSAKPYMSLVNEDLEVMFCGTSHVGYGIDPRLYTRRGMNITAGALNYECMALILEKFLAKAPSLRVLVIEAGIVPLRVDTMTRLDGDYRSLYRMGLSTFDLPLSPYRKLIQAIRESWLLYPVYFLDRWSPSSLVWGRRPMGSEGEGRVDTLGFTALNRMISDTNDGKVVVDQHQQDHLRIDRSAINLPALLHVIRLAESRNLPVLFIRLPHHATYVEVRPLEWEAQFQGMIAGVRNTIRPELFRFVDWERHFAFEDRHFADGDHLNLDGVRLLRDLLDPIISSYPARTP